jgi:G3E family GTPase
MKAEDQKTSRVQQRVPVTVVAGRPGDSKRAVIERIARSTGAARTIVLLRDTHEVGLQHVSVIDQAEHASQVLDHASDKHAHVCGCHSCAGEMQRALADAIFREAQSGEWEHLIIDCPEQLNSPTVVGLFQPHPHAVHPLGEVAFVQRIISVVETQSFTETFLSSRQQDPAESVRVLDQVEGANCLILDGARSRQTANRFAPLIRMLNPTAEFLFFDQLSIAANWGCENNSLEEWLKSGGAAWQRLLTANTAARISGGWVFRSRTPFHPGRLSEALNGPLKSIFRIKGVFFTANRMSEVGLLDRFGTRDFSTFRGTWWAATDCDQWPGNPTVRELIRRSFVEPFGDRQQEIALISPDLDSEFCERHLSACLLTREELEQGEQVWSLLRGPFPEAEPLQHIH